MIREISEACKLYVTRYFNVGRNCLQVEFYFQLCESDVFNEGTVEKVDCSSVCIDGFEPSNLFSSDALKRQQGFLCSSFVRPPVTLTFHFRQELKCINTIAIGTSIGEQTCTGLQLFTFTRRKNSRPKDPHQWRKLAEFVANEQSGFYPKFLVFSQLQLNQEHCQVLPGWLTNIKAICIKITRMKNASTPCISSIAVYCPLDETHQSNGAKICPTIEAGFHENTMGKLREAAVNFDQKMNEESGFEKFPEEFLDKLTQEPMSNPYLLPSGLNIDETSLHKIISLAESQGRVAYDPFSYQEFSSNNYPVENTALRNRIRTYNREFRLAKSTIVSNVNS